MDTYRQDSRNPHMQHGGQVALLLSIGKLEMHVFFFISRQAWT
jgi:hypothetical protein